jgi:hypothetical protein
MKPGVPQCGCDRPIIITRQEYILFDWLCSNTLCSCAIINPLPNPKQSCERPHIYSTYVLIPLSQFCTSILKVSLVNYRYGHKLFMSHHHKTPLVVFPFTQDNATLSFLNSLREIIMKQYTKQCSLAFLSVKFFFAIP